jgi:hypothetical protein
MAFWGGGCGDGWSLHLHFIVEGTEWGFLEGSLNRVGWLRAWLWMLVICNFTAQKSGCFFLCPPPPMNGKRTKPYRQGVSIHLLGIWMLSIGRLMDFTSVEPTRWSMDFRVVELMRCWTPCYIICLWVLITSNFTREREGKKKNRAPMVVKLCLPYLPWGTNPMRHFAHGWCHIQSAVPPPHSFQ